MSDVNLQGSFGGQGGSSLMFRNKLINGNFDVWQRADSQTSSGYGSDDRWINANSGSTKTHSKVAFPLGQTDVPGNSKYYSRTVVNSVAGANSYAIKFQRIEGVATLAGGKATLSFWAKADAAKDIAIELFQSFGSGGSPSTAVNGIASQKVTLSTSWQKYQIAVDIPSIAGKTIGTDENDYLAVLFWFDAGSSYDSRAAGLGQQSGTFDIAQVQFEEGSVASPFEHRPYGLELSLCQRYYQQTPIIRDVALATYTTTAAYGTYKLNVPMRTAPTVVINCIGVYTGGGSRPLSDWSLTSTTVQNYSITLSLQRTSGTTTLSTGGTLVYTSFASDAEL